MVLAMAVGPGTRLGALELLDAARLFLRLPYRVIVVDDSGELGTWRALARYPEVDLLRNWHRTGLQDLMRSLQRAYRHALDRYQFQALLKLDTDALVTGSGVDLDILEVLRAHPDVGMIGARRWRDQQQHLWKAHLEANPSMWRRLIETAERNGYVRGESVLGGAYAVSYPCLAAMASRGFLSLVPSGPRIAEDVVFSLFTCAAGYRLYDLSGAGQPLAMAWRGLPMPARQVLAEGKKVIHSLKFAPDDLRDRIVFARARRRVHQQGGDEIAPGTLALSVYSRRYGACLRWRGAAGRALRSNKRRRARRILWRAFKLAPATVWTWVGLAGTALPHRVFHAVDVARAAIARKMRCI